MKRSQGEGKETEKLEQLYVKLEQDWHAMKQNSNSRTAPSSPHYYDASPTTEPEPILQQQEEYPNHSCNSPRELMRELQREASPEEEEEEEEKFEESVDDDSKNLLFHDALNNNDDEDEGAEVRSTMSYDDEYEGSCSPGCYKCNYRFYASSVASSTPSSRSAGDAYYEDTEDDEEVKAVVDLLAAVTEMRVAGVVANMENNNNRRRRRRMSVFLRWLGYAVVMIALCVAYAFGSEHDHSDEFPAPT